MANSNYQRGVRYEREVIDHWRDTMKASIACRTAGSHGPFDVFVIHHGHPTFIQCKVTTSEAVAERLIRQFRENPPLPPSDKFHQMLTIKITNKGERSITL